MGMAILEDTFAIPTPTFESAMKLMGDCSNAFELSINFVAVGTALAVKSKLASHGVLGACLP